MFAGLLMLQLKAQTRSRRGPALGVAVFAAAAGLAAHFALPGPWAVILATALGATLGLALERWKSAPNSSR
jgi:predicted branched-subunit amino acid permease